MNTDVRLPILQTVLDIFIFTFRKFPSLFVLTLVAAVIAEPLTFLSLQFTGTFSELASLAQSSVVTDRITESLPKTGLCFLIVLMGALLFLALIAVPIIRHIVHVERLWLIRINTSTLRYLLSQLPVVLILMGIALYTFTATVAFGGFFTSSPVESGVMTLILLFPVVIALAYFGVRLSLVPVAAVASGSLNIGQGLALTKNNGFRLLLIIFMIGMPILIVGLNAMDTVLRLYSTEQDSLGAVGEPDASHIFNGGPMQILELYGYIFSKPAFIAANTIVFLFFAFGAGAMLSAPAIVYRKLTTG